MEWLNDISVFLKDHDIRAMELILVLILGLFMMRQPIMAWLNARRGKSNGNGTTGMEAALQSLKEDIAELRADSKAAHDKAHADMTEISSRLSTLEEQARSTKECIKDIFAKIAEIQQRLAVVETLLGVKGKRNEPEGAAHAAV